RVVDEDCGRSEQLPRLVERGLEGGSVGHVAGQEERLVRRRRQALDQRLAGLLLQIEEGHLCAVPGKGAHERLADASWPAGDQDDPVVETLVLREVHAMRRSVSGSNRQAVRVSTANDAFWPIASRASGATLARRRAPSTRSSTMVSAPVGSLIST